MRGFDEERVKSVNKPYPEYEKMLFIFVEYIQQGNELDNEADQYESEITQNLFQSVTYQLWECLFSMIEKMTY